MSGATLQSLPRELLHMILDNLSITSKERTLHQVSHDLLSAALVCHDWQYAWELLFSNVLLDSPKRLRNFRDCERRKHYRTLRLDLRVPQIYVDEAPWKVLKTCPDLKHLELEVIEWPWSQPVINLLITVPPLLKLETLRLNYVLHASDTIDLAHLFPRLRYLFISHKIPFQFMEVISTTSPPSLTNLGIDLLYPDEDMGNPVARDFYLPFQELLPSITTLRIRMNDPDKDHNDTLMGVLPLMKCIPRCSSLTRLEFVLLPPSAHKVEYAAAIFKLLSWVPTKLLSLRFIVPAGSSEFMLHIFAPLLYAPTVPSETLTAVSNVCEKLEEIDISCTREEFGALKVEVGNHETAKIGSTVIEELRAKKIRLKLSDWESS